MESQSQNTSTLSKITVKVDREVLLQKALKAARIIPEKSVIPIFECLLFEFTENNAALTGSNAHIQITTNLPIQASGDGAICIPAGIFISTLKLITEPSVLLQVKEKDGKSYIEIKVSKKSSYKISCFPAQDFPLRAVPKTEHELSVDGSLLKEAIKTCSKFINKDDKRPNLVGVHMRIKDKNLLLESTDTFSAALVNIPARSINTFNNIIMPYELCDIIVNNIMDSMVVDMLFNDTALMIKSIDLTINAALVAGKFPDCETIMIKKQDKYVILNRLEIEYILRRMKLYIGEQCCAVLKFKDNEVMLSASHDAYGNSAEESVEVQHEMDLEIGVNPDMLLNVLAQFEDSEVKVFCTDYRNPMFFSPISGSTELSGKEFFVMPVRI